MIKLSEYRNNNRRLKVHYNDLATTKTEDNKRKEEIENQTEVVTKKKSGTDSKAGVKWQKNESLKREED